MKLQWDFYIPIPCTASNSCFLISVEQAKKSMTDNFPFQKQLPPNYIGPVFSTCSGPAFSTCSMKSFSGPVTGFRSDISPIALELGKPTGFKWNATGVVLWFLFVPSQIQLRGRTTPLQFRVAKVHFPNVGLRWECVALGLTSRFCVGFF